MAKFQELKCDPELFELTLLGKRAWEIRFDDRGYAVEDVLRLRETRYTGAEMSTRELREVGLTPVVPKPLEYTGREVFAVVTNVFRGTQYGLKVGWVILSVNPMFQTNFGE
jgi:hypothetical protein